MEHSEWQGERYGDAPFDGEKIAICGHSHYVQDQDYEGVTNEILNSIIAGEKLPFFKSIQNYFGEACSATFWNKVLFFNFAPQSIGMPEDKYGRLNREQAQVGRERLLRILGHHKPHKLFVFTDAGWSQFPDFTGSIAGPDGPSFHASAATRGWGTYRDAEGHEVAAFGFRHPQGAPKDEMRDAVAAALAFKPEQVAISRR